MEMLLRRIRLVLPSAPIVQFHPIVLAVLDFAGIFQGLRKKISQVIVVGSVLESEVADIG